MGKRTFLLEFSGSAIVELDDAVIDVVDDEWRKDLYNLRTPEQIAEMVGRNLVCNGTNLSSLDGWADQPDQNARVISWPEWETEVIETTLKVKP